MNKIVIFDLDGTILDSQKDIALVCNASLEKFGLPTHPVSAYSQMVGSGVRNLILRATPESIHNTETFDKVERDYSEEYTRVCTGISTMFDGAVEMLAELKKAGYFVAVATNKPDALSKAVIANSLPAGLVDYTMGQTDEMPLKPDPAVVEAILEKFSVAKENAIFVGDSNVDIFTGHNAGLFAIGVSWGFRPREELAEAGADLIIDKFEDLAGAIIKKLGE